MAERKVPRGTRKTRVVATRDRTRLELLLAGELTVEELDDEEINRMQLRNNQGDFRGRPPLWVPREMALAFQQEFRRRFASKMQEMVPLALKGHEELLRSRHLAPGDAARMAAIKEVYERTIGKVVQTADVHMVVDKGRSFEDVTADVVMDLDMEEDEEDNA